MIPSETSLTPEWRKALFAVLCPPQDLARTKYPPSPPPHFNGTFKPFLSLSFTNPTSSKALATGHSYSSLRLSSANIQFPPNTYRLPGCLERLLNYIFVPGWHLCITWSFCSLVLLIPVVVSSIPHLSHLLSCSYPRTSIIGDDPISTIAISNIPLSDLYLLPFHSPALLPIPGILSLPSFIEM